MKLDIGKKSELSAAVRRALVKATGTEQSQEFIAAQHDVMLQRWHNEWQPKEDLSFYGGIDYAWQTFDCWNKWSNATMRMSLKWMQKYHTPKRILDFGAGIGATTAQIAMAFPEAQVLYTNMRGYQYETAKILFADLGLRNVTICDDDGFVGVDSLFAIELFEHIREPIPKLDELATKSVAVVIDGSSFHVDECGHWDTYLDDGKVLDKKPMRQRFTKRFTELGYQSAMKVFGCKPFWNRHPRAFARPDKFPQR